MEKVLLITLWGNSNFGNRLQLIALKRIIEQFGIVVECVPNDVTKNENRLKNNIKFVLGKYGMDKYKLIYLRKAREKALKKSSSKYIIPQTKCVHNFIIPSELNERDYIAAVVGSDQVWHRWTEYENELDFYYLSFIPKSKRISYAASFGFESFPENDKEKHLKYLNEMRAISCRERTGCKLIRDHLEKSAEWVLDPTLCVNLNFWTTIEEKPKFKIPDKYAVVMMLGNKSMYNSNIEKFLNLKKLSVIDINDYDNKDIWNITIGNFIWLIHHAQFIFTDSFHCTVFSILFERQFIVFRRDEREFEHMFDRIATLLDYLDLNHCVYEKNCIIEHAIDYATVKRKIDAMSKYSVNWLRNALNI